jgi:hypothetical protein
VDVTSPAGNDTVYNFSLDKAELIAGNSWISSISSYQGSAASGTLLRTTDSSFTYNKYGTFSVQNGQSGSGTYQLPASITNYVTLNDINYTSESLTTLYGDTPLPSKVTNWDFLTSTASRRSSTCRRL